MSLHDTPILYSIPLAVGYAHDRQFSGSLVVTPAAITFDSRSKAGINKLIGALYAPAQLGQVVHTAREVVLLRLRTAAITKWMVLDDHNVPVGGKRVIVALQWPRRNMVLRALDRGGYSVNELRIPKHEFHRFLSGEARA